MNEREYSSQHLLENASHQINYNSIEQIQTHNLEEKLFFTRLRSSFKGFKGIFLGLCAAFFFALFGDLNRMALFVTASEQSSMRYLMQIFLMVIIAKFSRENIFGPKEQRKLLLIRGVFGSISFISLGFSLRYIEPADTLALYNTRLVIIPILATIFLKEQLKLIHILSFILTIIGVVLVSEQSFFMNLNKTFRNISNNCTSNQTNENDFKYSTLAGIVGVALGLISAFAASLVAILLKKLAISNVHYSISVIFSSYIGLPMAFLISLIMYLTNTRDVNSREATNTPTKLAWQIFFSITSALCGCLNQLLVALANKYESANVLALVSTTSLFWSFLFDFLFLSNYTSNGGECLSFFNVFNIAGTLLILLAALISIIFKIFRNRN